MLDEILSNSSLRRLVGGAIGIVLGLLIWGLKLFFQWLFGSSRKSTREDEANFR